jgi:prepilin-type N-terminal cleavage/methylation domain-containing protein
MKKRNGFTLVELLAVIVVLAIIMIIAIPAVLDIMNNARRKSFALAIDKYVTAVQSKYITDANFGNLKGAGIYVYNIKSDLGLQSVGDNEGYIVVNATNVDDPVYVIYLHDSNYMIADYAVGTSKNANKLPDKDSEDIHDFNATFWNEHAGNELLACHSLYPDATCISADGYQLSAGN